MFQAKKPSRRWEEAQRDCAGLVRFAYREAIRVRSPDDGQKLGIPNALYLPEVSESSRKIFSDLSRIWQVCSDKDGKPHFGAFADAETLIGLISERKRGTCPWPETAI